MYIDELEDNTKIYIYAELEEQNVQFETSIIKPSQEQDVRVINHLMKKYDKLKFAVAKPIRTEGYLINFDSSIVTEKVIACLDEKVIAWTSPSIINIKLPMIGVCYLLVSKLDSKPFNRRKAYRQGINTMGTFAIGEENYDVLIKDISASGIGLFIDDKEAQIPEEGEITFKDAVTGDNFKIKCNVIRIDDNEKGLVVGCQFDVNSENIARYVSKKQFLQRNPDQAWRIKN